jgi:hypothetical protein
MMKKFVNYNNQKELKDCQESNNIHFHFAIHSDDVDGKWNKCEKCNNNMVFFPKPELINVYKNHLEKSKIKTKKNDLIYKNILDFGKNYPDELTISDDDEHEYRSRPGYITHVNNNELDDKISIESLYYEENNDKITNKIRIILLSNGISFD